ncbi:MAG: D-alanyl-D-alanine carboxypeptidase [Lachnospiraceae bacterium]|nr:D-alanyl-D-alanine carboxypeptidase [Lachnospiraceae bacterium]
MREVWLLFCKIWRKWIAFTLVILVVAGSSLHVSAEVSVSAPSAILVEASTGQVIYELNATERRSPASITKIMTLLIVFEQISEGKVTLMDEVTVSAYAMSMGGSQVYLEEGEVQTLDTLIKCITVASGNDAAVAVAEYIAGSEGAFVDMMNDKAAELGMQDTHFEDCCGLTDSDNHYTTARDVAIMSRELITRYPDIYHYTQIWMEDITHVTPRGEVLTTLANTNKLLKQYDWITGLKTGSTDKAKYCISATGSKDGVDMIAVVMGAPDPTGRFQDAATLLNYGFSVSQIYTDENTDILPRVPVEGGVSDEISLVYEGPFKHLDVAGNNLTLIEKELKLPESVKAPVEKGTVAGAAVYRLNGEVIGQVPILYGENVEKAFYRDYLLKIFHLFFL